MNTQIFNYNNDNNNNNNPVNNSASTGLLAIGEIINGYKIASLLRSDSGEAEIYICTKDNTEYVLKYYYNCNPKTEILEKIKSFNHPDVISLYEYGNYKEHFFEILEYAKGGSLDTKLPNGRYKYLPVSEETAVQIVKETINAFDACHKAGIIHRDIKPGNLFYKNADGSDILVGDFGISSQFDVEDGMSKHFTQAAARTEGYSAPEVYSGVIGSELDYYSLGVTLWELLTAKEPFVNENGNNMFPNEIMLNTIQGKMCDLLLSRAPELSPRMKNLIRGLMITRHDKRWNHDLVSRYLNGEEIPVFQEVTSIPSVTIGKTECTSFKDISQILITGSQEARDFVYKGLLPRYLARVDQKLASRISDKIDEYSANNQLDKGLFYIAYTLCPNLEFWISKDLCIRSLSDIEKLLETNPDLILPFLLDESKNFYNYLYVMGMKDACKKIKEIVEKSSNQYIIVPKILVALHGNDIAPFQDGVNNNLHLRDLKQLNNLAENLKQRILYLIDADNREVCAWIENLSGKDLTVWRKSLEKKSFHDKCTEWGKWYYFNLFLKGQNIPYYERFEEGLEGNLRYGLKDIKNEIAFPAAWNDIKADSVCNSFIVKKNGKWGVVSVEGKLIIPFNYADIEVWNPETNEYQVKTSDGRYALINVTNKPFYVGTEKLKHAACRNKPFAVVYSSTGIYSYSNNFLKKTYSFEDVLCYSDGNSVFVWAKTKGKYGFYDQNVRLLFQTPYDFIYQCFSSEYVLARKEGQFYLMELKTQKAITAGYSSSLYSEEAVILISNDNKFCVYKLGEGNSIRAEYTCLKNGNKNGTIVDRNDQVIQEFTYLWEFEQDFTGGLKFDGILNGFSNEGFFTFDCKTGKKELRSNLLPGEVELLAKVLPVNDMYNKFELFTEQKNFLAINKLVESVWKGYFDNQDYEMASFLLQYLRKDHTEGLLNQFDYYLGKLGLIAYRKNEYQDAFDYFQAASEMNPSVCEYCWRGGDAAYQGKNYQVALNYFEKALALDPSNADLYNRKANALYSLEKYQEAIAMYSLAIDKYECKVFYTNRANAYEKLAEKGAPELRQKAQEDKKRAEVL